MSPHTSSLGCHSSLFAKADSLVLLRFIIAPLDVVKIRLQLQPSSLGPNPLSPSRNVQAPYRGTFATVRHIFRNEGVTGFWKGNVPAELMYVCYASIQFGTYRSATILLQTGLPGAYRLPDAAESFVAGASAGAVATSLTYPLDLLRTRFAAQGTQRVYSSMRGAVAEIWRDEGARGFFRGLTPALVQIVPFMGIFFVTYERLRICLAGYNMRWGSGDATAGVIASVVSKTSVFPLDLVRKRIQVQGPTRSRYIYSDIPEYKGAFRAVAMIARTEGVRGLFKGLPISLVKSAPASAVTLWTYERVLSTLISLDQDKKDKKDAALIP